jgi:hypothetical protein
MKTMIIATTALFSSITAFANVSGRVPLLSCKSSNESIQFEIRDTAFSTSKKGLLSFHEAGGSTRVKLKCDAVHFEPTPGMADELIPIWSCTEARSGEGLYHVEVTEGGFVGRTMASISIDQMFPLPAMHIETLFCDR